MLKTLQLLLATVGLTATVAAADLTWGRLATRPDLWPEHCAARRALDFQGGFHVAAGQELTVLRVGASAVEVSTADGRVRFPLPPEDTDLLAVAQATFGALTPRQQELTIEAVVARRELWPYRVTLRKGLDLGGGRALRPGDQLQVLAVAPGTLTLLAENLGASFSFAPEATDFMAQARKFLEDPEAGPRYAVVNRHADEVRDRDGPVIGEMDGKLVNVVTDRPEPLDPGAVPRYIVFYRGASTDPFTRGFTPTLLKYYAEMKPRHPEFEIVYLMTEPPGVTAKFAKKMGFAWRAVTPEATVTMPTTARAIGNLLPQLIVMDRAGHVLIDGMQTNAVTALRDLDEFLRSPPARN